MFKYIFKLSHRDKKLKNLQNLTKLIIIVIFTTSHMKV